MRTFSLLLASSLATFCVAERAAAQRHSGGSSPPTAPHSGQPHPVLPVTAVSSGMGALQFFAVNYGVPAPQSLTRQLQADDDRTRAASLAAIGAPAQYLARGHIPYPHSSQLDFIALGNSDELDAVLTVELDQHIVSAILMPEDGNWHRVATVLYATAFSDPATAPSTFLRLARGLIQQERYRAIFHASSTASNGDFVENEAQLRVLNNKAIVTISFASDARTCDNGGKHAGCDVTHRWFQADATDPAHRFLLVTATGRLSAHDFSDPLVHSEGFQMAHLRTFTCQPFGYSETSLHYEPTANAAPCGAAH